jgi:hypothetical protein
MSRAGLLSLLLLAGCAHGLAEDENAREKWCRDVVESPSSRPDQRSACQRFLNELAPKRSQRPEREVITGWRLARGPSPLQ